jgi:hypothetical protein
MDIIEVGVDARSVQRLTPASEMLLGGTYQSRMITSRLAINEALLGRVHSAKDGLNLGLGRYPHTFAVCCSESFL